MRESSAGPGALDPSRAFAISAYVGYDDNRPMVSPSGQRVAGAAGALPAWIGAAQAIVKSRQYDESVDPYDLQYVETRRRLAELPVEGAQAVPVEAGGGLPAYPLQAGDAAEFDRQGTPYMFLEGRSGAYGFEPRRLFAPVSVKAGGPD